MRHDGRHARGTWTPQVAPGSGGRRRLREAPAPEPATVAVGALRSAATTVLAPVAARAAGPIRYAPVPGAPRRSSLAVWGPPRPAGA